MFLLHVEARGYLPVQSDAYYQDSARKLADQCRKEQWEYDSNSTRLWDSLRKLTRMIRHGDTSVGVPAYNGSLFAPDRFPGAETLENIEIPDTFIAPAIRAITFDPDQSDAGLDYAGLQVGHLGAIYEALLALTLTRANEDLKYDAKRDVFRPMQAGEEAEITASELFYQTEKGGRKAGGVYYTREEFVQHLLRNSLVPALDEHLGRIERLVKTDPKSAARNLFDFSIVDPAMGSGHFLTTALDMMADRIELFLADIGGLPTIRDQLDELKRGEEQDLATIEDVDLLRRLILKRCIYGVDISPMAVEVANVTLWLASFVPGLALSYLGSNLKCGDALIGVADPEVVGSSDSPLFTGTNVGSAMEKAAELQREISEMSDLTPDQVKRSQERHDKMNVATAGLRRAFDLWTAEPLGLKGARHELETSASKILNGEHNSSDGLTDITEQSELLANRYRFFHWPLEFPSVFYGDQPGFDVVAGNPPWDKIKFEKPNFLAINDPGYKGLKFGIDRDAREAKLFSANPNLQHEMESLIQDIAKRRAFFNPENGYSRQGAGDTDLYKLFCDRYVSLANPCGYISVVLPRATFINQGSQRFREWLFSTCDVRRIDFILNRKRWAFDIHPQFAIALLSGRRTKPDSIVRINVSGPALDEDRFNELSTSSGISMPIPTEEESYLVASVETQLHADLLLKLRRGPAFINLHLHQDNDSHEPPVAPARPIPYTELHESAQRRMWNLSDGDGDTYVWKGRSFNQYDPHGEDPAGTGVWDDLYEFICKDNLGSTAFKHLRGFVLEELSKRIAVNNVRIAFRDVTNSTNSRTVIACLIPPRTPLTHTAPFLTFLNWEQPKWLAVLGVMNSLCFDWLSRRYVGSHLSYFILNMLTFPPSDNTPWQQIGQLAARLSCVDERFADFASEAGVDYGPQTDAERDDMRAEIDALVARAYDLTEDELSFVFTDFTERAVTPAYRQLVLEKFDRL